MHDDQALQPRSALADAEWLLPAWTALMAAGAVLALLSRAAFAPRQAA